MDVTIGAYIVENKGNKEQVYNRNIGTLSIGRPLLHCHGELALRYGQVCKEQEIQ